MLYSSTRLIVDYLHLILAGFLRQIRGIMLCTNSTCKSVHEPDSMAPLHTVHCNQGAGIIPQNIMFTSKTARYALVAATIAISTTAVYASGMFPDITVGSGGVTVSQPGVGSVSASSNPFKPVPEVHAEGNGELAKGVNAADKLARAPQELPGQVLEAAKSEIMKQVDNFIADLKTKFWAKYEELKKQYLPYVYLAAAGLIAILMLPGFIGALFAIWVVRLLDRRQARKQKRELNRALAVVKDHADEIHTKLAA
jgi:hypothetical protein